MRVMVIGLDGYEPSLGNEMMAQGAMPCLDRLRNSSACFTLDHGSAKRTGLAWEHVSSGMSPARANRWSAVHFDKDTYGVRQEGARFAPFTAVTDVNTVIFDLPYFRLESSPDVRGITAWGAHDPGTAMASNPVDLLEEISGKFGDYPATDWIYGFAWPSVEKCQRMGDALADATLLRSKIARWLFSERLSDWELGFLVVSELHSVAEGLWHGVDPEHPLAQHPSAEAAGVGVRKVYTAVDRLIGELHEALPDTIFVVFSMHGMGVNQSDVPSMVLLPDLLFRHSFGRSAIRQTAPSVQTAGDIPMLRPDEIWGVDIIPPATWSYRLQTRLANWGRSGGQTGSLHWMPAARYQPYWRKMRAFALPSFYDGQIRLNLKGRESKGQFSVKQFDDVRREVVELLLACRDPRTGDKVVADIEYHESASPFDIDSSAADITVVWQGSPLAFEHPELGLVGPLPYRRPGGHTGDRGVAWIHGAGLEAADHGVYSAFDMVPTILDLLNQSVPDPVSGSSLLGRARIRESAG